MTTAAPRDPLRRLGRGALASRLKRLSDRLYAEARQVYAQRTLGFEPRWFPVFQPLAQGQELSVTGLAELIGFTHPAVVQLVNELVREGLVQTRQDSKDRRRRLVRLSARGRALLPELTRAWDDIGAATGEVLAQAGADVLGALERFEQALEARGVQIRAAERQKARDREAVEILPWDPAHRRRFAQLNRAWIEELFELEAEDRKILGDPEGTVLARGGTILFARLEGRVVGTCAVVPRGEGRWELTKMAVEAKVRGRQVGRRLAESAIALARKSGAKAMVLETSPRLEPAMALYRSLGFSPAPDPGRSKFSRPSLTLQLPLRRA